MEICSEIEAKKQELADLFEGGGVEENMIVPKKRKYTKHVKTEGTKSDSKTIKTNGVVKTCCGSRGWKHKSDCSNKLPPALRATQEAMTGGAEGDGKEQELRCGQCEDRFTGVLLDAVCPSCNSTDVYKMYL